MMCHGCHLHSPLVRHAAGHGLDWVWPFILGYPQEKIAIINDVCVIHPKKELQPGTKLTIYKEHNPHAELVAVLAKFGYESEVSRCAVSAHQQSRPYASCLKSKGFP